MMPSSSKKQHNFMAAVAHSPSFAKKVGISQSVGSDFVKADKGKTFSKGGDMKESKAMVAKEMAFLKKKGAPKSMMKHEAKEMKKGGCANMMKGGAVKHKNANQLGGDLPGSKHHGRTTGEGVEKSYKANTKAVKHGRDGVAQRGLTKVGRSKEM